MRQLRYYSMMLWLLLRSIPPVSPGRLVMPAIFLASWTLLSQLMASADIAFVASAITAQLAQIWAGLPGVAQREWRSNGNGSATRSIGLVIYLIVAVQVWWADPWLSQRILSAGCAIYVAVMCWGAFGDRDVLNAFSRPAPGSEVPLVARKHLLKLAALTAFLVIVVNETLMVMAAPLGARVATLALTPIALHIFYEIALRLTLPFGSDAEEEY